MLALKIPILLLTIIFALVGVYLIIRVYTLGRRIDDKLLRARAFLNESFLKDNWKLILSALLLFIIRAVVELEETFELFMGDNDSEIIDEVIELGILLCIILLAYKWFKLMNPAERLEQVTEKESQSTKSF